MNRDISSDADIIDVRDIIARVEELHTELTEVKDETSEQAGEMELRTWIMNLDVAKHPFSDSIEELITLEALLEELKGNGGDEQWRGDWYPITLIRDSYFETAMDELLEDIGDMPKNIPPYLKVTVDYDALQMDYSIVEYDSITYWYR